MSSPPPLADALDVLLRFGALMLRSGEAAFRAHDDMHALAPRLGITDFALSITVTTLTATARRGAEQVTLVRHVGPLGINAWRLGVLERLAQQGPASLAPDALAAELDALERAPPLHPIAVTAAAVGLASGAFAWLNGGNLAEVLAAFVAGALGQGLRQSLLGRRLNQYAVTAFCGVAAAAFYSVAAAALTRLGLAPGHGIGVIAAALFLVPGFPLVAALLDLLQHQIPAALVRLAYGATLLLAAAGGLGVMVALTHFTPPAPHPPAADLPITLLLRAVASFIGGCGFAVLYNTAWRPVLAVGVLAVIGNELRLALQDAGTSQAVATFAGALAVGLQASILRLRVHEPRIALTVPGIIIMVPGGTAFDSFVLLSRGDVTGGLQAAVVVGFVVGAMALGLAVARFASERKWLFEA